MSGGPAHHTKENKIMKTTLNLTTAGAALVLFASTLVMPMQANAADRQISINPRLDKIKTFTVQTDDKETAGVDLASTSPEIPTKPVKTQEFRVNDDDTAEVEQVKPPSQPKQPNSKRFKVDDSSEQAAQEPVVQQPTFDNEDADEPPVSSRPAKILTQKVKPAPVETEEGSDVTEEVDNEVIAADQPEATAEAATDDEAAMQKEYAELLRQKHEILLKRAHQQYQDDGSYQDSYQPTYQQSYQTNYEGASCEHNNNGY
jgi:hypothetical protein